MSGASAITFETLRRTPAGAALVKSLEDDEQRLIDRQAKAKLIASLQQQHEAAQATAKKKQTESAAKIKAASDAYMAAVAEAHLSCAAAEAAAHSLERQIDRARVFLRDSASSLIADFCRELQTEADATMSRANRPGGWVVDRGIDTAAVERRTTILAALAEAEDLRFLALSEQELERRIGLIRAKLRRA